MKLKLKSWAIWTLVILVGMWFGGFFSGFLPQTGNPLIDIFIIAFPGGIISYWLWHRWARRYAD